MSSQDGSRLEKNAMDPFPHAIEVLCITTPQLVFICFQLHGIQVLFSSLLLTFVFVVHFSYRELINLVFRFRGQCSWWGGGDTITLFKRPMEYNTAK